MRLDDLVRRLDEDLDVENAQDGPWRWVSGEALALCHPRFQSWGAGLMLEASSEVRRVLCMTFLSEPLLEQALSAGAGTMVFTHHPMDLRGDGPGFVAIPHQVLWKLKEAGVSIYCAHAPLDAAENHRSTGASLARVAGVEPRGYFVPYPVKPAGIFGILRESNFDVLIGASHYATESVAVRGMVDYFLTLGLEAEFLVDRAKGPWDQ